MGKSVKNHYFGFKNLYIDFKDVVLRQRLDKRGTGVIKNVCW